VEIGPHRLAPPETAAGSAARRDRSTDRAGRSAEPTGEAVHFANQIHEVVDLAAGRRRVPVHGLAGAHVK
jgi:hypothetical protein